MDKTWISLPYKLDRRFLDGISAFLQFAYANKEPTSTIKCPCTRCRLSVSESKKNVFEHVIMYGFLETYTHWDRHGEAPSHQHVPETEILHSENNMEDDMERLVGETFGNQGLNGEYTGGEPHEHFKGPNEETRNFFDLLESARTELFPGCKEFTLLSFIVRMLHTKSLGGWSNKSFTMHLKQHKAAYHRDDVRFPSSYYEARKLLKDMGLEYKKIHACENDCMLFVETSINTCLKCGASRYKRVEDQLEDEENKEKKIPVKVVRYFPLKPRLQRLYMSSKTAKSLRWHAEERIKDGVLRHPADSLAWRSLDEKYPDFASDCKNVRLGLAADGFNPFKTMNVAHSTWPVILIPYNLPPWMCMKQSFFMLTLLIDGPHSPGNNIDVYLKLVVDELNDLWNNGILTYDIESNEMFQMRASLLWTINDFPAYANLSGWSTKGMFACPCCNKETRSDWLTHGKKFCYLGHRRFLDKGHKFRDNAASFDGTRERQGKPMRLSGDELLVELESVTTEYGKVRKAATVPRKRKTSSSSGSSTRREDNWKKKSVFFELPYWKDLLIRHNIDIMHTEKNVCDSLIYTLLDVKGKSKDNLNARLDLEEMRIRKTLHPERRGNNSLYLPPASFTMSKEDKDIFLNLLKDVRFPDGYASNISRCVKPKERTLYGLKSHDCHVLVQQLLPLCVRKVLPKKVCQALIEFSSCLRLLYSKVSRPSDFEALQDRIALVLCHLEVIFPPAFFDIMVHLTIHLPEEAMIAGPVQYRSMSSIERYLGTLKGYVRNRSRPEGSIAEGYLAEECMTFCSMYLHDVESKLNRSSRNDEGGDGDLGEGSGRPLGNWSKPFRMDETSWVQAHRYILFNTDGIDSFRKKHKEELKRINPRATGFTIDKEHNTHFYKWFRDHINDLENKGNCADLPVNVKLIAGFPDKWARRSTGYISNGVRFRTYERERMLKTQNSGIMLSARTESFSSTKDKNPVSGDVTYYGRITDIIQLRYTNELKFVLFKCDWINNARGKIQDMYKFTLVNFQHLLYRQNRLSDEPFILASQAEQVWYVKDPIDKDWHVVMKMTPRDYFDMGNEESIEDGSDKLLQPHARQELDDNNFGNAEDNMWVRNDIYNSFIFPIENKEKAWKEIKANHDVDDSFKPVCMKMLGKRWRDFKSDLKRKYRHASYEERLQNRDARVEETQWPALVAHWSSRKHKKMSKRNRRSRKMQKMVNASGRKSHANVRDEIHKDTGQEPSKFDVFLKTRKRKNGDLVDDATEEAAQKMEELLSQETEEMQSDVTVKNRIFDQVLGPEKSSRVRTFGTGPTLKQVFGTSFTNSNTSDISIKEKVRETIREILLEDYGEEIRERMRQGIINEEIREQMRRETEEIRGEIRQELEDKIRAEIKQEFEDKIEAMRQEMKSAFDEMRLANEHIVSNRSHYVPSDNTQVLDAPSAHRLASNNEIELQHPSMNKLKLRSNSCDRSHDINQDVQQRKKQNDTTMNKMKTKKQIQYFAPEVEDYVELLDYKGPKQVVARGILLSKNRYKIVGGKELGNECWEVLVKEALKPNEDLLRPYEGVSNIGEAVGKTVAWRFFDVISKNRAYTWAYISYMLNHILFNLIYSKIYCYLLQEMIIEDSDLRKKILWRISKTLGYM